MREVKEGDTVLLYDEERGKSVILSIEGEGGKLSTDKGSIEVSQILGKRYGTRVKTHKGFSYILLPCTLYDFIMHKLTRLTQIVYPKDAVYIVLRLDVREGDTVLECGTGSGAMTAVFARAVGRSGRVVSYEKREEFVKNALSNLRKLNLHRNVQIKHRDAIGGFDERDVDAVFLDVREPWLYLDHAYASLKVGGMLGILVPTVNQVIETLKKLESMSFADVEVCEILLRKYKTVPERLRPEDRMPAHTAYLTFARKLPEG